MKNYIKKYTFLSVLCVSSCIYAGRTININLQPYPLTQKDISAMLAEVEKPGRLPKSQMEALLKPAPVNGILVSYSGFLDNSDENGLVSFVRKTNSPHINLVITKDVKPIYTFGNTVHHWELKNDNAAFFTVRKEFDPKTKLSYWDAKKEDLPANKVIPHEGVILFTDPEYIFVPEGVTPIKESGENLFVPPIYVRKNIPLIDNDLETLLVTHLLRPEKKEVKHEGAVVQEVINEGSK
jgi:hypothetical protein